MKDFLKNIIQEAVREADITEEIDDIICSLNVQEMIETTLRDHLLTQPWFEEVIEEKLKDAIAEEITSYSVDCIIDEKLDDFFR